jgi:TolB-like protein
MSLRGMLKELHHRNVLKVAVAYVATGAVLLEVLTHLFHNFEAPLWVLKVITTLLILGLPVACLMAWGFEFKEGSVRSVPRVPKEPKLPLPEPEVAIIPSIAVLPFADMSAEHNQQYLGDGIAEELLNALASIEGLNVAARTSSFSFAGRDASMAEIGDTLHVRHVLEGSVRRSGQKLRVTAQLIDVRSGFHLFSESYDREVQDIFDIQNEIAHEIALALLPKLGLRREVMLVKQGTTNLEAYNLHLRARQWLAAPSPENARTATEELKRAISLDPHYADAWADLSYVYGMGSTWTGNPVPLVVEASRAAAIALFQSPTNVIALLCQAYVAMLVKRDAATADSYYAQASASGVDLTFLAFQRAFVYYGPLGRFDEAIALLKEAERKDPLALNLKHALIEMHLASGRAKEALEYARVLLRHGSPGPDAMANSARAFLAAGDMDRAKQVLDTLRESIVGDQLHVTSLELWLNAAGGDREGVQNLLARLLSRQREQQDVSAYLIGEVYKTLGNYDQTINWWSRAIERYEAWTLVVMAIRNRNDPVMGSDPRFLMLLDRMGLGANSSALQRPFQ